MRVRLQPRARHQSRPYDSGVSESNMNEQKKSHKDAVRSMVEKVERDLDTKKATLGHYVRLLQLERELEAEEPTNIEVKWVESENSDQ